MKQARKKTSIYLHEGKEIKMKKRIKKGFTLVELLVVIAILAILASVTVVGYSAFTQKAKDSVAQQELTQIHNYLYAEDINNDSITFTKDGLVVADGDTNYDNDATFVTGLITKEFDLTDYQLTLEGTNGTYTSMKLVTPEGGKHTVSLK